MSGFENQASLHRRHFNLDLCSRSSKFWSAELLLCESVPCFNSIHCKCI